MKSPTRRLLAVFVVLASPAVVPGSAIAAQGYDNCSGFIESLPVTISTQGVWCLNKNLSTAITYGNAITIAANNVTIDCNDFKVGGLAAGNGSNAFGVSATNRQNVTVRHCNIRGFAYGLVLNNGAGHLVEDNRFDNNLVGGIFVTGANSLLQRNRLYDTGGHSALNAITPFGISATADVIDNTVAGVFAARDNASPTGIRISGASTVRNNRVRALEASGTGIALGIDVLDAGGMIAGNQIIGAGTAGVAGSGIQGAGNHVNPDISCSNNVIEGFANPMHACVDAGGNTSL